MSLLRHAPAPAPAPCYSPLSLPLSSIRSVQDGYIVTNAHVVKAAKVGGVVEVTLCNGHKYPGRVWGMDEASDLALVKLEEGGGGDFGACVCE